MPSLSGKIITAIADLDSQDEYKIGERLRDLRKLAGFTQQELSVAMGIGQTALSRLENRADIHFSSIKNYVEALGANLEIDAAFDANSAVALRIRDAFDLDLHDENQLVFPIFSEEEFRKSRDVVLSIKPQYSEPIIRGIKKVELRRRFPISVPKGTLAYIYSTSPTRALTGIAEIDSVKKYPVKSIWTNYSKVACIKKRDFTDYFRGVDDGFVIKFKSARALNTPISLHELRDRFEFEPPQSFLYAKPHLREALRYESSTVSN